MNESEDKYYNWKGLRLPVVYLSGAISGLDRGEREKAFSEAERKFTEEDMIVFNPLRNGIDVDASYEEHLRADLRELVSRADYICLIDKGRRNVPFSKGVYIEKRIAEACGIPETAYRDDINMNNQP